MQEWNLSNSGKKFFEKLLQQHTNVQSYTIVDEILFKVKRKLGSDIDMIVVDQYALSEADVIDIISKNRSINIICLSGAWSRYTYEAKQYALERNIGVFVPQEINGAISKSQKLWEYVKKEKDGTPITFYSFKL